MRKTFSIIFMLFSLLAYSQDIGLSLDQAIQLALEHNRDAKASELDIKKAEHAVKETIAIGLPQVNAEGKFQHFLDIATQVLPDFISPSVYGVLLEEDLIDEGPSGPPATIPAQFGTEYTMSGGITANQLIFNGSYLVGLQASRSFLELSQVQKERTILDVKAAVSQAYYTAVLARENTRLLEENQKTISDMLGDSQAMYEEGFIEEQDVQQLQYTLNSLTDRAENARRQVDLSLQVLNFNIGRPLGTAIELSDDMNSLSDPNRFGSVAIEQEPDLSAHPNVKLGLSNMKLKELSLKEQKSQYLPVLSGFFSYSRQAQLNEFDFFERSTEWFPTSVWGLNLSVPIFSSGNKHQKVKQKEIELLDAELEWETAKEATTLAAKKARSDHQFAMDSRESALENMNLAKSIRDKTRVKYQEGIASGFELNQMETQYLEAEGQYLNASFQLMQAITELKKAYNNL